MDAHSEPSLLRLASAKRRVAAFLDQIAELKASSFPHSGGLTALKEIEKAFLFEEGRLDIPPGALDDLVDETCIHLAELISTYTDILGFILRSTNVRNPFELHFALAKLVRSAIGEDIKVLISSEWNIIPFTYPMSLDILPDFVLIGSPAPESGNVLIAPLSGHEIGHTAWRSYDCVDPLSASVAAQVDASLKLLPKTEASLLRELGLGALGRNLIADRCGQHALRQLEEIFCDLFGLFVFGSGYLFAYDYFLAPGNRNCYLDYPSDERRIKILEDAAKTLSIPVDEALIQRWELASYDKEDTDMGIIVDHVVSAIVSDMRQALFAELASRQIFVPDQNVITKILASFTRREPFRDRATLAEIVAAGWSYLRRGNGLCLPAQREEYKALGDLMLKSIEVAEFLERLSEGA